MKSSRCETFVRNELSKTGLCYNIIELGKVEIKGNISEDYLKMLDITLKDIGLEIIYNKETLLIGKIKEAIEQMIYLPDDFPKPNFPDYISIKVNRDYN